MSKKKEFLKDVKHEIDMLKEHATEEEKNKLDLDSFNPENKSSCIYGQMTGDCTSNRAKELMDSACIRVMDVENGTDGIVGISISDRDFKINGDYKGQTWREGYRTYKFLSALEGYICTKNANISGIMEYIKGNTDTLIL